MPLCGSNRIQGIFGADPDLKTLASTDPDQAPAPQHCLLEHFFVLFLCNLFSCPMKRLYLPLSAFRTSPRSGKLLRGRRVSFLIYVNFLPLAVGCLLIVPIYSLYIKSPRYVDIRFLKKENCYLYSLINCF